MTSPPLSLPAPPADAAYTDEQLEEYIAAAADPGYFCDQFLVIDDAQDTGGEASGTTPFRLWPAQFGVMAKIATERQTIILKARQLGISWLVCAYVLWLCLFKSGQVVLLFSKGQAEANELIRRIKALYERLPDWLRAMVPAKVEPDSVREITWHNGSRVKSMPATKSAGVSYTASLIVLDEAAHMLHGQQLYLNAKPTIDGDGQLVVLSTANGIGGLFHKLWTKAVGGASSFAAIFLPWWARPGRTKAWYRQILADSDDPGAVPQNYPANALEAFLVSGRVRFPSPWVIAQQENVREPIPRERWPDSLLNPRDLRGAVGHLPNLRVYAAPLPNEEYVVAADVSEGLETGDADAAFVFRRRTMEEVASLHGRWEPDEFADMLAALGYAFNGAPIIVERNNHGHAVLTTLKLRSYPRIADGEDGAPGWHTNVKTKPESIDLLAASLRDAAITIRTEAALNELLTYRVLKGGKTGAEDDAHDDLVMALAVLVAWVRLQTSGHVGAPAVGGTNRAAVATKPVHQPPAPIRPQVPKPAGVWP